MVGIFLNFHLKCLFVLVSSDNSSIVVQSPRNHCMNSMKTMKWSSNILGECVYLCKYGFRCSKQQIVDITLRFSSIREAKNPHQYPWKMIYDSLA